MTEQESRDTARKAIKDPALLAELERGWARRDREEALRHARADGPYEDERPDLASVPLVRAHELTRTYHFGLDVTVPAHIKAETVADALNSALDEPPCVWDEWEVGNVSQRP